MLNKLDVGNFDEIFRLMEESFPIDEYRTYEEQKALLLKPFYNIYTVGKADAFAAVWEFDNFLYVDHLAVSPKLRGKGIGSHILKELMGQTKKIIILEAEPPEDKISIRRINFYISNGFFLNSFTYIQPPISKGRKPVPLMLMSRGRKLKPQEFENIKNKLYKIVYNTDKDFTEKNNLY